MDCKIERDYMKYLFMSTRHKDVTCALHFHTRAEIVLVRRGTLNMEISGKEYSIKEGSGVFIAPFEPHSFSSISKNKCHVLEFSKEIVPYFFEFLQNRIANNHFFRAGKASVALLETVLSKDGKNVDFTEALAVLAPLLYDVRAQCKFAERKCSFEIIELALSYIDVHFKEPLSLESVSRAIGVHYVTVSKAFSDKTGIGFSLYLQYVRASHAARLIKTTDMTFTEIAYASGFGSIRSFNRSFLNIYGITPTEYKTSREI